MSKVNSASQPDAAGYLHNVLTALALLLVFIALVIPNNLDWINLQSLGFFPLELPLLGLLLLLPGPMGTVLRFSASLLLATGIIFKIADISAYQVFARTFNAVFDSYLLLDGMQLLNGAIGTLGAVLVAVLLVALVVAIFLLSHGALVHLQGLLRANTRSSAKILVACLAGWLILDATGFNRTSTYFSDQLTMHVKNTFTSIEDLRNFRQVVNDDITHDLAGSALFEKLQGKDVLVIFLESYGRTVVDNPAFAAHVIPVLEKGSADLKAAGIQAKSAYLTSPTVGGISWLAHGTALSGLWIDSQVRYDSLMMSERATLNRLFQRAGWRTVAIMPAISMAWPEGDYFGYDQIYAAADLGYQGKPFNWVTMPDQYAMSAFQTRERQPGPRAPVMAEIALISSHAPWTPIPTMVGWDQVGDGTIFNAQASAGDAPEVVWKDPERIRTQYRLSIEYAMTDLVSYAIRYGDENLVILIMGDHQPAPLVTGDSSNHDVPVHLIARDPQVMDAIADWGWSDGLVPAATPAVWRMDEVRDRFINAFSASMPQSVSPYDNNARQTAPAN